MMHYFDIEIATKYGIEEAIILNNIYFWVEKNKANKKHFHDGYYWTYNSKKAFAELFPYMNERKIKYALDNLKKHDLIYTGNYNKIVYDRTLWYTISEHGYNLINHLPIGQNCPMEKTKTSNLYHIKNTDEKLNITIEHSNECPVDFSSKSNIFKELTEVYGNEKTTQTISFVSDYIDNLYVVLTGKQHKKESKAKRATFAKKLLECAELFILEFDEIKELVEMIANDTDKKIDPTIYYITTPKVLGYWLLTTELVDFTDLANTEYQPVDEMY